MRTIETIHVDEAQYDELQVAHDELEAVFEANPDGLLVLDLDGRMTRANEALLALLGKSRDQVVGRSCREVLQTPICGSDLCPLHNPPQGNTAAKIETTITGEARAIPCLVSVRPVRSPDGTQTGIVESIRDIRERKRYEEALLESQQAAIRANENRDQFLRNISHELRTPLNGIIGMSSLLAGTQLDDQQRMFVNTVVTSSDHLLALVNDLLDFTRIEAGRLSLSESSLNVRDLAEELRLLFAWKAKERGLGFGVTVDEGVPSTIGTDRVRLKQVLSNIMDNAIKFTEQGAVRLTIRPGSDAEHLCYEVSDTGVGMESREVPSIFESFRQLDGSYARHRGGLGLGLSIARKLVQLMNGRIDVETTPGEGTTMSVRLPYRDHTRPALELETTSDTVISERSGRLVLVVEDEPINTLYLEELLHTHGCRVTSVRTGEEALIAVAKNRFDIALIDIGLPTISGIETARRIRERELTDGDGRIPIVALTAHAFDEDRQACMDAGMDDFLTKPLDESALFQTLDSLSRPA